VLEQAETLAMAMLVSTPTFGSGHKVRWPRERNVSLARTPVAPSQKPTYWEVPAVASLVALKMMKPSKSRQAALDWHVRRSAAEAVPANLRADGTSILREVVRRNVVKTVCRVGLWSLFTGLGAYWLFPAGQKLWLVLLTGSAESGALSDTTQGYVGNILALMSVLFSILAGNSYTSLYGQNEAIFCALFAEVSEAKALMEQIALVCSGRPFYRSALENIRRYVKQDLRRLDMPPSILCALKPRDDPLESILYLTSVGVPSTVYETVRSLRQRRGDRLGAVQRKLPPVQMALLYVLAGLNLVSLLLLALRIPSEAEYRLCRGLFAMMAGGLMMTMRVIHELWTPVGGAYNVDGVLRVMITGLEDELDQRLQGKTFSDTRLPPPPPSFQRPNKAENKAGSMAK